MCNSKISKKSKNVSKLLQIFKCLKFHIYVLMTNQKNVMHWGNFKYFLEQAIKKFIQNSFACQS
jgi:hypothetical protein